MRPNTFGAAGRLAGVAATAAALVLGVAAVDAQHDDALPTRPDDATIAHVLNRIGFGPRPGDVARVNQMGLARSDIDQQLHPDRISDDAIESRLAEYTTLSMSSRELAEKIFLPRTVNCESRSRRKRPEPMRPIRP